VDAERDIIIRMLGGTQSPPDRRGSICAPTAGTAREAAAIQLACALSQFAYRMTLAGVQAARDDRQGCDGPEYEQMSIAAIDVGAACLDQIKAIRPGLLSTEDAEMLMVHLRDQRTIKAPPVGELHDLAMVLAVWTGDVAREIQNANELMLSSDSDSPDMALAALERAIASCVDLALLGGLLAPNPLAERD
jgi:hypothetical protein